jgi:uncharacterized protein (DUF1330 family)
MPAYIIVDINVHDPKGYEAYKLAAPAAVALFGGRYLARGGRTEVLEGDAHPGRIVILEFDSIERAKEWLHSPEYGPARSLRHKTASTSMIAVEGA